MKTHVALSAAFLTALVYASNARPEKQTPLANVRKVYVTGLNLGQVEWAYKNFTEHKDSCVTPVSTPEEADAILTIDPRYSSDAKQNSDGSFWVNCTSSRSSTTCIDSTGYESTTSCVTARNGAVSCTSSYGPSLSAAIMDALRQAARNTFVVVSLYTKDGKTQLWRAEESTVAHGWAYALSKRVGCVQQKCPVTHFKPCDTKWYDASQIGPDGKLKPAASSN